MGQDIQQLGEREGTKDRMPPEVLASKPKPYTRPMLKHLGSVRELTFVTKGSQARDATVTRFPP